MMLKTDNAKSLSFATSLLLKAFLKMQLKLKVRSLQMILILFLSAPNH
jgi:hypothetical protein